MAVEIRSASRDELTAFARALELAAGRQPPDSADDHGYQADRTLVAVEGGIVIGGTASEPISLTVPGLAEVPAAKITLTGVLPGHRRRGIASEFMRRQLRDLVEPLAVLTTSQSNVPARYGFAPATRSLAADLRPAPREVPPLKLVDAGQARRTLPGIYDRHRGVQTGQVTRSARFWRTWFDDDPLLRIGESPRFIVTTTKSDGYLSYRLDYGPLREQPVRRMVVEDLIAATDAACRALWAYCLGFDQAPLVHVWNLPPDAPVLWLASGMGEVTVTASRPFLRLRVTDVTAALSARSYAVTDQLVLDVADDVLPANSRRFLLDGGPDGATCRPTGRRPDLTLPVGSLAALYLGGATASALARAGLIAPATEGAARRADLMFGGTGAPWTVTDW